MPAIRSVSLRLVSIFLCAAVILGLVPVQPVQAAAIIYVATTGTDSPACGPLNQPCKTIQYAIKEKSSAGDTIIIAAGTYSTTSGHILVEIDRDLTLYGAGINQTILDGGGEQMVVYVANSITVTIQNLTIQNGGDYASSAEEYGVGIQNYGTLTVENCEIAHNHKDLTAHPNSKGGGIFNTGTLEVSKSYIHDNTASYGGGIFSNNKLTVEYSTIANNSYIGVVSYDNPLLINDSTITGNLLGGINVNGSGTNTVTYATIGKNDGYEIAVVGTTIKITNSIILADNANSCFSGSGTWNSGGHNISYRLNNAEQSVCVLLGTTDQNVNPQLGSLVSSIGSVPVMPISSSSPAYDAIPKQLYFPGYGMTNNFCPLLGTRADQRGMPRPAFNACDIGAYEVNPQVFVPLVAK